MTQEDTTTTAQRNQEIVLGALSAAQAGDMDAFLGAMHPDVQLHEPPYLPYGGEYRGRKGFVELFARATEILDLTNIELISATAGEDRTVLLMRVRLRRSGEMVHITEHWCVEHGQITDVRVFWFELPDFTTSADQQRMSIPATTTM